MRKETLKRLGVPVFFMLLFLIPALIWDTLILQVSSDLIRRSIWVGRYVIGTCLWLTLAWFVIRCLDVVVWPVFIEHRLGYAVPRLLKDFVRLVIVAIAIGVIISVVFEQSVTGFFAASGVVGLILGVALRDMIADFFSGIALNLERSFAVGDRVLIEGTDLTGDIVESLASRRPPSRASGSPTNAAWNISWSIRCRSIASGGACVPPSCAVS